MDGVGTDRHDGEKQDNKGAAKTRVQGYFDFK
jgi:hypothetical protein